MATPAALSTYASHELLDHLLATGAYTPAATVYAGLYSAAPSDAGGGTQLTGAGGYARQAMAFDAADAGATANTGVITFGPATGADWAPATHYGVFDADTAGNMLAWGALDDVRTVAVGDSAEYAAGALDLAFASLGTDQISMFAANKLLDLMFRNTAWARVATFAGLYTVAPTQAGGGTEVSTSGTAYIRKVMAFHGAASEAARQDGAVAFPTATAAWGTVVYAGLFDVEAAGNMLFYWNITDRIITTGKTMSFADDKVVVGLD